jgi:hypothetical protein
VAESYLCRDCSKLVAPTKANRYRTHRGREQGNCIASGTDIPKDLLEQGPDDPKKDPGVPVKGKDYETCPECRKNVKLTRLGYFENHNTTLYGGERCGTSGVRAFHSGNTKDLPLPGDELPPKGVFMQQMPRVSDSAIAEPAPATEATSAPLMLTAGSSSEKVAPDLPRPTALIGLLQQELGSDLLTLRLDPALAADSGASTETSSPESATTSSDSGEWTGDLDSLFLETFHNMLMDALGAEETPAPASSGFNDLLFEARPAETAKPEPVSDLAKTLATQIKETFYAYSNRKTTDNRSAQTSLGPSEIGTPCDRRLAMSLMGIEPVNPGGDGWAAFVGTCTHVGMANVYEHANAGTGRYAVELPVFLGMPTVPKGTTDLLDRRDGTIVDWKVMGFSSLKAFKQRGPSQTYRIQAHVYGRGAELGGEKVRNVAIVGLPRGGFSLDEMHIWTEKYDRDLAQEALDRVEEINGRIAQMAGQVAFDGTGPASPMEAAREFAATPDCSYCPFLLKGDKEMVRGCPGK